MGGAIGFSSEPNRGSTFWIVLPLVAASEREPQAAVPSGDLKGTRVLVVDDLDLNRRVIGAQLRQWGILFEATASGADGLRMLRAAARRGEPYHIAVLDFLMPEMDGETLGRLIREDPTLNDVAQVMLTSGGQRGDAERFLTAGFSAYLVKPVARPKHLYSALLRARYRSAPETAARIAEPVRTAPAVASMTAKRTGDDSAGALPNSSRRG